MDTTPRHRPDILRTAVAAALAMVLTVLAVHPAAGADHAGDFVRRVNAARASAGLPSLAVAGDLAEVARRHSQRMADRNDLHHNPNLGAEVSNWRRLTENVGRGVDVEGLHRAFMDSPGHRANILDGEVSQIGVGVVVGADGTMWVTQVFRAPADQPAPQPAPEPEPAPAPEPTPAPTATATPPAPAPAAPLTIVPAVDAIAPAPDPAADAHLVHVLERVEALDG